MQKRYYISTINTEADLKYNLTFTIRKFLSRSIVIAYTAQKQTKVNNKPIFSQTTFYKCLQGNHFMYINFISF